MQAHLVVPMGESPAAANDCHAALLTKLLVWARIQSFTYAAGAGGPRANGGSNGGGCNGGGGGGALPPPARPSRPPSRPRRPALTQTTQTLPPGGHGCCAGRLCPRPGAGRRPSTATRATGHRPGGHRTRRRPLAAPPWPLSQVPPERRRRVPRPLRVRLLPAARPGRLGSTRASTSTAPDPLGRSDVVRVTPRTLPRTTLHAASHPPPVCLRSPFRPVLPAPRRLPWWTPVTPPPPPLRPSPPAAPGPPPPVPAPVLPSPRPRPRRPDPRLLLLPRPRRPRHPGRPRTRTASWRCSWRPSPGAWPGLVTSRALAAG